MSHNKRRKLTSIESASKKFFFKVKFKPKTEIVSVYNGTSRILAQDIASKIEIPSFDKSSMDGYAIKSRDTISANKKNPISLKIRGKIFAGQKTNKSIRTGETFAVATGAPIPKGADAVIMIEDTVLIGNEIRFSKKIRKHTNLALRGEEVRKNQVILKKGRLLLPQDLGLIASVGIDRIPVYAKPNVGILVTGNELVRPGKSLKTGKIFESNSIVVSELVKHAGGNANHLGIARDEKRIIKKKIQDALDNDILVITGGSSVGEKDFVSEIINELGKPGVIVKGISMKPGVPTTLGVIKNTPIIVCPGFPVSAYFGFLIFGVSLIRHVLGRKDLVLPKIHAEMEEGVNTNKDVTNFVRVKLREVDGRILAKSVSTADSRLLTTLTESDGVVMVKNKESLKKGEKIEVFAFSNSSKENI